MTGEATQVNVACSAIDVGAYVDGELNEIEARFAEAHFEECSSCREELNLQKRFLATLDAGLTREIAAPADFTRKVIANAEGRVEGLRVERERLNAVFIIAALGLFVLFAAGADVWPGLESVALAGEQLFAIAGIVASAVFSFFVGVAVVLRTIAAPADGFLLPVLAACVIAAAVASRSLSRLSRY